MAAPLALGVRVLSQTRMFPETRQTDGPSEVPLSILDATVAHFAPSAAIWMYDQPTEEQGRKALSIEHLTLSLRKTLNAYPQWAGQLQWAPYKPHGDHNQRFGRVKLSWGNDSDPGVEFVVAHCPRLLPSLVASPAERRAGTKSWDAGQITFKELLPATSLALRGWGDSTGSPGMIIQLTTFDCGGTAVAVKMAHCLADAQSLTHFVHDWASVNRALLIDAPLPSLSPVFDPLLLDRAAAGDIDSANPDPAIVKEARDLPLRRYDWWASADGCPPMLSGDTQVPPELDPADICPPDVPMPWSEWDLAAPVSHFLVHFTADEINRMWNEASSPSSSGDPLSAIHVSRMDALLAHVWALMNRARGLERDDQDVNLNVTFGFRTRLSPSLPENFLGSPIMLARVSSSGSQASTDSPGTMAASIRSTLARLHASTLPALLHDAAHEIAAQRVWQAFLGRRNAIVTSWVHLGLYALDFGTGEGPRYVEAVMPSMDGCVQVMEAASSRRGGADTHGSGSAKDGGKAKHWYDDGVDVSLHIRTDVMQKLLKDPLLRKYSR